MFEHKNKNFHMTIYEYERWYKIGNHTGIPDFNKIKNQNDEKYKNKRYKH